MITVRLALRKLIFLVLVVVTDVNFSIFLSSSVNACGCSSNGATCTGNCCVTYGTHCECFDAGTDNCKSVSPIGKRFSLLMI